MQTSLGLVPAKEDNEAMRQGRDLEEYVAFHRENRSELKGRNILINDVNPFMHANIDRRIVGTLEGLECKTTSVYNDTDFEGGDVPLVLHPVPALHGSHWMACMVSGLLVPQQRDSTPSR